MAYTSNYDTTDLREIFVDILGSLGAEAVVFIGLIVLIVIVTALWLQARKLGRTVNL